MLTTPAVAHSLGNAARRNADMQAHERFQRDTVPCLGNRRTNRELSIHFHLGIHKEVQRPDDGTASLHVSVDVVIAVGMPFAVPMEKVIGFPSAAGEEQIVPPRIVPHDARQRAIEVGIDDPTFRRSDSLQSIVTAVERNSSGLSVHSAKVCRPSAPNVDGRNLLPGAYVDSSPDGQGNPNPLRHRCRLPKFIEKARRLSAKSPRFLVGLNGLEPSTFTMST